MLFSDLASRVPIQLTACGLVEMADLASKYPNVQFLRADARALPFSDGAFDRAHSNAVIEHIIGEDGKRAMLKEMLRVAGHVFVTTPNRHFPIEVHSRLPFIHWLPPAVHNRALAMMGLSELSRGQYFEPLSQRDLEALFPLGITPAINYGDPIKVTLVATASINPRA